MGPTHIAKRAGRQATPGCPSRLDPHHDGCGDGCCGVEGMPGVARCACGRLWTACECCLLPLRGTARRPRRGHRAGMPAGY